MSFVDTIFPKKPFIDMPTKFKIDLYKFSFTSTEEKYKSGEIWKKSLVREYLVPVEKAQIQKIFENYSLPRIDETRNIWISPFQLLNIVDAVIVIIFIYVAKNLIFNR